VGLQRSLAALTEYGSAATTRSFAIVVAAVFCCGSLALSSSSGAPR
jgi:hypothetical protein